ncbi:MAG: alpha-galactosidase [Novosphingobium sp.]
MLERQAQGAPLWRYWGPRLANDFAAGPALADEPCFKGFLLDQPLRLDVFPGTGLGWFGMSPLEAHREGRDFAFAATATAIERTENGLIIRLDDAVAKIAVTLRLTLDPASDVLTQSSELTNLGQAALDVQWLASGVLPLPADSTQVRHYAGRHANEWIPQQDPLGRATWLRENRRGLTSHDTFPGAVVVADGTTAHAGPAYAAHLAWSGNHRQAIDWIGDGRWQWQMGLLLAPGELRLAAGESVTTPDLLATCSSQGWQGAASNFHQAMRGRVDWPGGAMAPRPVHLNTWEGYYFDHDEAALIALADRAAAIGIERFVLDDGWFHRRNDDTAALGDWWCDAAKYPNGLLPLARHVRALGMEFGLWIEPEMVNPDSDLYRAHPDWALHIAGRPLQTSRNQLVLDLTRPEVGDYLFETIGKVIADLPLAYLKWDHNRDLAAAADSMGRAAFRRQTLAYYDLLRRFRAAFPQVEIEGCAGGGGRIDAGVLPYVHRFWTSDCIDALSRLRMQQGFLQFFPPELMGSHIGTAPAHTTGRSQGMDFRAAVACQGHLGVELDLRTLSDDDRQGVMGWIAFYKEWRHLLHTQTWSGSASDGLVWHAAGSPEEWLLFVYRTEPTAQHFAPPLRLPFVAEGARYAVTRIDPGHEGAVARYDASWLRQSGLPVPPMLAERAVIYHGKALDHGGAGHGQT